MGVREFCSNYVYATRLSPQVGCSLRARGTCVRSLHRRGNASRFAYINRLHFDLVQRCLALRCQPTPFTQVVSVRSRMAEHFALYRHAQRHCARAVH